MNSQFIEEEAWITHKYMKRFSTSPGITEMQLKSAGRWHFRSVRLANIKRIISSIGRIRGNSWGCKWVLVFLESTLTYFMK